jgi:iron complex outermembrane receptor protein
MWSQQDADFYGGEAEIRFDVGEYAHGHWQLYGFADVVRAEFDDGGKVPRIPPARLGAGVEWHWADWAANLDWIHASRQDRVADYETATPGYDLLNLDVSSGLPIGQRSSWEVYARAHNLLDEDVRNHTSFLKDQAPQIGRNFLAGVRGRF